MEDFNVYFGVGVQHILGRNFEGLDHILFVIALCLRYLWKDWKQVTILVTAFTIGHSVTLALCALNYLDFSAEWIEFLIPVTIAVTCLNNIFQKPAAKVSKLPLIYFFALFFGLIHGVAFGGEFSSFASGSRLVAALFGFNVGIEVAQLGIVAVILFLSWLMVQAIKLPRMLWLRFASVLILAFSLKWAWQRFPLNKTYNDDEKALVIDGSRFRMDQCAVGTAYPEQSRL